MGRREKRSSMRTSSEISLPDRLPVTSFLILLLASRKLLDPASPEFSLPSAHCPVSCAPILVSCNRSVLHSLLSV
eukprot:173553-Hanusia_phi.AAC.4